MYGSGTLSVKYNPPSNNIKSQLAFVAEFIHSNITHLQITSNHNFYRVVPGAENSSDVI